MVSVINILLQVEYRGSCDNANIIVFHITFFVLMILVINIYLYAEYSRFEIYSKKKTLHARTRKIFYLQKTVYPQLFAPVLGINYSYVAEREGESSKRFLRLSKNKSSL